ncbi:hypothetical protein AMTR_s00072p00161190 [Amborella trichopoda]|uniref:Uncharacterized protein n=1 Tax=Amborella trichopoda TaxID=13333 RepID=W1NTH9_AMBTC|nr:hypothetical protein AMTR_s00072p00161190 [Amborella trichopoda]
MISIIAYLLYWCDPYDHVIQHVMVSEVKVRIECRSPFGDYGGGVETKGGTYRVRLNGAEGPHYPLRFCWAHVPDRSIPKDCPIPVNTKSNFTMVETTTGRATLEASPLIFRTT